MSQLYVCENGAVVGMSDGRIEIKSEQIERSIPFGYRTLQSSGDRVQESGQGIVFRKNAVLPDNISALTANWQTATGKYEALPCGFPDP
jgi:hypothetical protein